MLWLALIVTGCGYNPETPVYDVAENPAGFPPAAIGVIERLESHPRWPADSLTSDFADLYSEHPELMSDDRWLDVVDKVGLKVRYRADQLVDSGLAHFPEAGGLYSFAAAARPDDGRAVYTARMFLCLDSSALSFATPAADSIPLVSRLNFLHRRLFGDIACHEFTRQYLGKQLLEPFLGVHSTAVQIVRSLPARYGALTDYLGYHVASPESSIVHFEDPEIRVVAFNRDLMGDRSAVRIEWYVVAEERIAPDWELWMVSDTVPAGAVIDSGLGFKAAVQLTTWEPVEEWEPGHVMVVTAQLPTATKGQRWQLALVDREDDRYTFATDRLTGKMFVPVTLSLSNSSD